MSKDFHCFYNALVLAKRGQKLKCVLHMRVSNTRDSTVTFDNYSRPKVTFAFGSLRVRAVCPNSLFLCPFWPQIIREPRHSPKNPQMEVGTKVWEKVDKTVGSTTAPDTVQNLPPKKFGKLPMKHLKTSFEVSERMSSWESIQLQLLWKSGSFCFGFRFGCQIRVVHSLFLRAFPSSSRRTDRPFHEETYQSRTFWAEGLFYFSRWNPTIATSTEQIDSLTSAL